MELLTASSLRARHGFPTRAAGNSSFLVGDDPTVVRANLDALARAANVEPAQLFSVKQVHGDRVVLAQESTSDTEADALITRTSGSAVGVRTADCLPVLLEDRRTGAVAAVHAGWRGVIAEIVVRALEQLVGEGGRDEVHAAIGPCIQRCCFEVDGDLPARFTGAFGAEVLLRAEGRKDRLDLVRAVQLSLSRAGVPDSHVVALPQCTMCDARFFSHRREHGKTGRHLSFIAADGASTL